MTCGITHLFLSWAIHDPTSAFGHVPYRPLVLPALQVLLRSWCGRIRSVLGIGPDQELNMVLMMNLAEGQWTSKENVEALIGILASPYLLR